MSELNTEQSEETAGNVIEGEVLNTEGNPAEPGETGEGEGEPGEGEQKQSRSQNAKQRLRRKLREEQNLSLQLADENKQLNERLNALEGKLDSVVNPPPARPNRVDFETEEDYEDALLDWRIAKSDTSAAASDDTGDAGKPKPTGARPRTVVPDNVRENWLDQVDDAGEKYEDFSEVMESIPDESLTDAMTRAIMESSQGGEITYFLGKNHDEAARIAKLSFTSQVIEIGKLSEKLSNHQSSSAPDPIDPARGGGDAGSVDIDKMSPEQYRDYRRKQMADKRK